MRMKYASKPDGFMPDGTPVYLKCARGSAKSMIQLDIYRKLVGISDEEWTTLKLEAMRRLGYLKD